MMIRPLHLQTLLLAVLLLCVLFLQVRVTDFAKLNVWNLAHVRIVV